MYSISQIIAILNQKLSGRNPNYKIIIDDIFLYLSLVSFIFTFESLIIFIFNLNSDWYFGSKFSLNSRLNLEFKLEFRWESELAWMYDNLGFYEKLDKINKERIPAWFKSIMLNHRGKDHPFGAYLRLIHSTPDTLYDFKTISLKFKPSNSYLAELNLPSWFQMAKLEYDLKIRLKTYY